MNAPTQQPQPTLPSQKQIGILTLLALVPCLSAVVFGSHNTNGPACLVTRDRPALVFSEYLADYGPVPVIQQPTLAPEFVFRNNGSEKVKITNLRASCGCLTPRISTRELDPDAIGSLSLPIRLNNEPSGPREYTVTVEYLDPKPRQVTLTVKAVLPEKTLLVEPRVLMVMGALNANQEHILTISDFRSESLDHPFHVSSVTASSSFFTAELASQFVREGANCTSVSVKFRENTPEGRHRGVVTVATDDEAYPLIQIPVLIGDIKRDPTDSVHVAPEMGRVVVDSANPKQSIGTVITVDIPSRWKVTHCDTFPGEILAKYESVPSQTADQQTVSVSLSINELPTRGIEQAVLTLNATDGDAPEMVTVPVNLVWK